MPKPRGVTRNPWWSLSACALLVIPVGCAPVHLRGENFPDEFARWGETNRAASNEGTSLHGYSTKAQQIERNVGVR